MSIHDFLTRLFQDADPNAWVCFQYFSGDGYTSGNTLTQQEWFRVRDIDAAAAFAEERADRDLYVASSVFKSKSRRSENVAGRRWLVLEFDGEKHPELGVFDVLPVDPTLVVRSSYGANSRENLHLYFDLEGWFDATDLVRVDAANKALAKSHPALGEVKDAARVLRVPGTVHSKDPRNHQTVEFLEDTGAVHDLAELLYRFPPPAPVERPPAVGAVHSSEEACSFVRRVHAKYLAEIPGSRHPSVIQGIGAMWNLAREGHLGAVGAIQGLIDAGQRELEAHPRDTGPDPETEMDAVRSWVAENLTDPLPEEGSGCSPETCDGGYKGFPVPDDWLPAGMSWDEWFRDVYDPWMLRRRAGAREVVVRTDSETLKWFYDTVGTGHLERVYYHGGVLVWIDGSGVPVPLTGVGLQALLHRLFHPVRLKEIKDPETKQRRLVKLPTEFPQRLTSQMVSFPDRYPHVKSIDGFVGFPVLRRDGTVLSGAGFDAGTGLWLTSADAPAVPVEPGPGDLRKARETLLDVALVDFPWKDDNARANYLGALLTPLLREIVPAPYKVVAVSANVRGSGKGYLTRLFGELYGGGLNPEFESDDSELKKSVLATLSQPGILAGWDNVTGNVRSGVLESLVTSDTYRGRILGVSANAEYANDRVWFLNGNNLQLGGDLSRRHVRVELETTLSRPELRTRFVINDRYGYGFEEYVRRHRGELLWSLLVLCAHWVAVGRPVDVRSSDSYAAWSATVRGVLEAAGIPGTFDDPGAEVDAMSTDEREWYGWLCEVREVLGEEWCTARQHAEMLRNPEFGRLESLDPDALPGGLAKDLARIRMGEDLGGFVSTLGRWYRNRSGTPVGGLRLVSEGSGGKSRTARRWRVEVGE